MAGSWLMIWGFFALFGTPLLLAGAILRLCEKSWQKKRGELGSNGFLLSGLALWLPAVIYFGVACLPR